MFRYPRNSGLTEEQILDIIFRGGSGGIQDQVVVLDSRCYYLPLYRDERTTCVLNVSVNIQMTVPTSRVLASKSQNTAYNANRTLANCEASNTHIGVSAPFREFGRYRGTGDALIQACSIRRYLTAHGETGIKPDDELIDCGTPYHTYPTPRKWELTCAGFREGWTSGMPKWTLEDCGAGSSTPRYSCSDPGRNTVDGTATNNATLFRDGAAHKVRYGKSEVRGSGITINSVSTTITRDASSTPWGHAGNYANANAANKEFQILRNGTSMLSTATRTRVMSGYAQDFELRSVWASESGKPTITQADYFHNLTYRMTSARITGYDGRTGEADIERITVSVPTTAHCYSNKLTTNFVRAVNDSAS